MFEKGYAVPELLTPALPPAPSWFPLPIGWLILLAIVVGLAALFLCGGAYFPWYGIWLVVPLVLSRPRWPLPAIVLTAMTASSTFPIFHGTGVLGAYALAWTAALLGALAAGWLLRPRPAGTADQTSPIHFQ